MVFAQTLVARRLEDVWSIIPEGVTGRHWSIPTQRVFSHWPVRGGTQWTPQRLTWVASMMAWDEGQTLDSRWEHAREVAGGLHGHWSLGTSYSGFAAALVRESPRIIAGIKTKFRKAMLDMGSRYQTRCGWRAFAADGSRVEAPLTLANEAGLGCAGREKSGPQVFVTTLWHMGLGLPWDFRVGPGTDSERRHLEQMLDDLPKKSLIVADAGFVGYELCQRVLSAGQSFLLRVGGNIRLLTDLGWEHEQRDGLVYLWPLKHRDLPPLVLRLIVLRRGKQEIYLLTNVLDPKQLSDEEAGVLYEMRWGIEVFYRSYKQTLHRRRLLSRTPATCLAESSWTMLGLWLLGLLAVTEIVAKKVDPLSWSVALARNAVRRAMGASVQGGKGRRLFRDLAMAVKDGYQRRGLKAARDYPRKKREKPPGPPKIQTASPKEVQTAKQLRDKISTAA
jgi:Transposase DDE domain